LIASVHADRLSSCLHAFSPAFLDPVFYLPGYLSATLNHYGMALGMVQLEEKDAEAFCDTFKLLHEELVRSLILPVVVHLFLCRSLMYRASGVEPNEIYISIIPANVWNKSEEN
jgi:hypothetical protein